MRPGDSSSANWSIACLALALFPYLDLSRKTGATRFDQTLRWLVVGGIVAAVFLSQHQASMLAAIAGAIVYFASRFSKKLGLGLVTAGWLGGIAMTPLFGAARKRQYDRPPPIARSFWRLQAVWSARFDVVNSEVCASQDSILPPGSRLPYAFLCSVETRRGPTGG